MAWQPSFSARDFFCTFANLQAFRLASEWPASWGGEGSGRVALLTGPEAGGKSHLAHLWCERLAQAGLVWRRVEAASLSRETWHELAAPASSPAGLVLEGCDAIAGRAEAGLKHFLDEQSAQQGPESGSGGEGPEQRGGQEEQGWALLTARDVRAFTLPDLATRLAALPGARIEPPDDALFEAVLAKHFSDRGIRPGEGVLRWLVQRLERSYLAAAEAVERLDASALAEGRELRLPLLHQVFKDL